MTFVLGVDPGPVVGLLGLDITETPKLEPAVVQCSANVFMDVLHSLYVPDMVLAVEQYVDGRGSLNDPGAQRTARALIQRCEYFAQDHANVQFVTRSAAAVKPWATDGRLLQSGLLGATVGMRHARDAARHALFAAVHDAGMCDPLSRRADFGPDHVDRQTGERVI